jgi:chorismate synthase
VAKKVLKRKGIEVFSYVKELAGVGYTAPAAPDAEDILKYTENYKRMRRDFDPFYQEIYEKGRIRQDMRFLEKTAVLAEIEKEIEEIRGKAPKMDPDEIAAKYGVHHILNCPDIDSAQAMVEKSNRIRDDGDSCGGIVEVVATGVPPGLGEPVFDKLDGQLGKMLGIGAVKGVEVGAGFGVRDMTGSQSNDQIRSENGKIIFESNHAGGITGGLATGQPIVVRLAVKPTPTIAKPQTTVDKYTLENRELKAITRRDATIVGRIWPVAENYTAIVLLDNLMAHYGYQAFIER